MIMMEGIKCTNCGTSYVPPINTCLSCGNTEFEEVDFDGEGEIDVFTTIYVPPSEYSGDEPYTVAVIELEEGPKLTARVDADPDDIELGKKVEFVSDEKYKVFELVE